jgi:hypothetical protein
MTRTPTAKPGSLTRCLVALSIGTLVAITLVPSGGASMHPEPPCPNVEAIPMQDGPILLEWDPVDESVDGYTVFKNIIISAPPHQQQYVAVATLGPNETSYLDEDTTIGAPHQYSVVAATGEEADVTCPIVEATAIPVFNGALLVGIGALAGLVGYATLKRRSGA